ncbi:MAG: hypothetical protein BRD50_00215 [Bacteroidetes bacterium SW_11_45_7]|nr:MAG: hypothetical protein BRD50_00215 [Bacteroidetes bacterium SW_11_45_7]
MSRSPTGTGVPCRRQYPSSLPDYSCTPDTSQLYLQPKGAAYQANVNTPNAPLDLCDTIPVTVEVTSTQIASIRDLQIQVDLPQNSGLSYEAGSSDLLFPQSSNYNSVGEPAISANNLSWLADTLDPGLNAEGLPGVVKPDSNSVKLQFDLRTNCQFVDGTSFSVNIAGRTACGDQLQPLYLSSAPIRIQGAEASYQTRVDVASDTIFGCDKSQLMQVSIKNLGAGSTDTTDEIVVTLPEGLRYGGSLNGIHNSPPNGTPVINNIGGGRQELIWSTADSVTPGDSIVFEFGVEASYLAACDTFSADVEVLANSSILCVANNSYCTTSSPTGSGNVVIPVRKPSYSINNLNASYTVSGNDFDVQLNGNLTNSGRGTLPGDTTAIYFYCDADQNGAFSPPDVMLHRFVTTQSINSTPLSFTDSFSVNNNSCTISCSDNIIATVFPNPNDPQCACDTAVTTTKPDFAPHAYGDTSLCRGDSTLFTATGGTQYNWTPSQNVTDPTSSSPIVYPDSTKYYEVVISDNNGCQNRDTVDIEVFDNPGADFTKGFDCHTHELALTDLSTAGSAPINNWQWSFGDNTSSSTQNPVHTYNTAGNYHVSLGITDTNSCIDSISKLHVEPSFLTLQIDSTKDIACNGSSDGWISTSPKGGTPPYELSLNGGPYQQQSQFTGLPSGTHTIVLRDDSACVDTQTITITEPPALSTSITDQWNVSCNGGSDGQVTVQANGGSPPYEYALDGGAYQPSGTFTGLAQGNYNVIVRDDSACIDTQSVTITEPQPITIQLLDSTHISCHGQNDGALSVSTTGGTGSIEFSLNGGSFQNTGSFSGLPAGEFIITARDDSLCTKSDTFTLRQPNSLSVNGTVVPEYCNQENGSTKLTVNGGTQPYSYSWQPPQSGQENIIDLKAGNYNVTVTDSQNCKTTASYQINHIDAPATRTSIQEVSCFGAKDGQARVDIDGTTAPYDIQWSNGESDTAITNVDGGIYGVTVTDTFGCKATDTAAIFEPPETKIDAGRDTTIFLGTNASLSPSVNNVGYLADYFWSSPDKVVCDNCLETRVSPIETTTYTIEAKDKWNCVYKDSLTVKVNEKDRLLYIPNAFSPNDDGNNDRFRVYAPGIDQINVKIFDRWGELVYETFDPQGGWDGTINDKKAGSGVYVYVINIEYKDGYTTQKQGSVTLIR